MGPCDNQPTKIVFVVSGTSIGKETKDTQGLINAQVRALAMNGIDAQKVALRPLQKYELVHAYGSLNLRLNSSNVSAVLGSRS